jgi:phage-related protein
LIRAIPQLVAQIPQIITAIVTGLGKAIPAIIDVGKNIARGLWDGIASMVTWLKNKVSDMVGGIVKGVKGLLGIRSPSRVFAGIGENMGEGIGVGFEKAMDDVSEDMQKAVPTDFDVNSDLNINGGTGGSYGMVGGSLITIQQMIVRSEDDIRKISQELYNLMQTGSRAQGRFITT